MKTEILARYAELKIKEKEIAEEIKATKSLVMAEMQSEGLDKAPTNLGTFLIIPLVRWQFSLDVTKAEKELDALKESEKQTGKAERSEVLSLKFFQPKNGESNEV